ncbi:coiled-coil domain-containing protein 90B, mitochondrial isoform X5 [Macrotis lagotis]|uniref:coiled-coil domain-containing protein 90B, mitochondrial isoform X5 n=1 Tax=Macrotis lagotis TaxID=92651 RepID=UPI003D68F59E
MRARWAPGLLHGGLSGALSLPGRPVGGAGGPLAPCRGLLTTSSRKSYNIRRVDIAPLEQRKLNFDTHGLVQDLESQGFEKAQAETIVFALTVLSNVSLDTIYKEMVTRAQQPFQVEEFAISVVADLEAMFILIEDV